MIALYICMGVWAAYGAVMVVQEIIKTKHINDRVQRERHEWEKIDEEERK